MIEQIQIETHNIFSHIQYLLQQMDEDTYTMPINCLSNSSVGNHTRHIIELYIELQNGYATGIVNYDKRKRDYNIETNIGFALACLHQIESNINKQDKTMQLVSGFSNNESIKTTTSYYRELIYNIEHAVHHLAIIKIGVAAIGAIELPNEFGVAAATIQFKKLCAQ